MGLGGGAGFPGMGGGAGFPGMEGMGGMGGAGFPGMEGMDDGAGFPGMGGGAGFPGMGGEEESKDDPNKGLMEMMKKMYEEGDEETKKMMTEAMMKGMADQK